VTDDEQKVTIWIKQFKPSDDMSVAIKDSIDLTGSVTSLASKVTTDWLPAEADAEVVTQLKQAGFNICGKVNMHEIAFGMTGVNSNTGTPVNPLFPNYITGGSSSASAAVVASQGVNFALGTDTGGSVRVPAACCGVYGFKPTFGRVSRVGVWPQNSSLDCVGGFASSIEGLKKLHSKLDDQLNWDIDGLPLSSINVGFYCGQADTEITQTLNQALRTAGVDVNHIEIPLFDDAFNAGMTLIASETYQACDSFADSEQLGADVKGRLQAAKNISQTQVETAERVRESFTTAFDQLLKTYPIVMMPGLPSAPLRMDEALAGKQDLNISRFARPLNLSGHPALVIPINTNQEWPCSLQLVAGKNQDALLFDFAKKLVARLNTSTTKEQ